MIWMKGRIVPEDAVNISALDRTFEHGLGLFETFRTWSGHATLFDRHLARMTDSAVELRIPLERRDLPNNEAVAELLRSDGVVGDAMLRITLTGGVSEEAGSCVWMRSAPLPPPMGERGALVDVELWQVSRHDRLARHKSLNYWGKRLAYENARRRGFDEVLSMSPGTRLWEGSRTNLFLVVRDSLVTPCLDGPIVPGIMRALVLELASALPLRLVETGNLRCEELQDADEVFLTNSVRGLIPVGRALDLQWPAPGPWTQRLGLLATDWLNGGGTTG